MIAEAVSNFEFRMFPEQASNHAPRLDALYFYLIGVSIFFTILIACLIVYFAVKYRRRDPNERPPRQSGGLVLEFVWSAVPLGFAMSFFYWGAKLYFEEYNPPPDAMEVHVLAKQWMWKLQHPQGQREINELHVPLGRPVKLLMTSQDVVHSFFVPAFRVKQDVVPGRFASLWFTPSKEGEYHLFCAEYCGTKHSGMTGRVIVMKPTEYEAWLAGTAADVPPAVSGERLFRKLGCIDCHGSKAPSLAGLSGRSVRLSSGEVIPADDNYIRESILDSTAKIVAGYRPLMPSYRGQLSEEQLLHLIAFIKSLQAAAETAPEGGQ
jgi:cytochrome c oxidase subunit II